MCYMEWLFGPVLGGQLLEKKKIKKMLNLVHNFNVLMHQYYLKTENKRVTHRNNYKHEKI